LKQQGVVQLQMIGDRILCGDHYLSRIKERAWSAVKTVHALCSLMAVITVEFAPLQLMGAAKE